MIPWCGDCHEIEIRATHCPPFSMTFWDFCWSIKIFQKKQIDKALNIFSRYFDLDRGLYHLFKWITQPEVQPEEADHPPHLQPHPTYPELSELEQRLHR